MHEHWQFVQSCKLSRTPASLTSDDFKLGTAKILSLCRPNQYGLNDAVLRACGSKFLVANKGARYQRVLASIQPTSILFYWPQDEYTEEERPVFQRQIAGHMLKVQEKDGSWWDYQLFNFHKAYGTGYILIALGRCRPGAP